MKKSLALILCLSMFAIITACDNSAQKVKLDTTSLMMLASGPKLTYPEIKNLAGTTWRKQVFSSILFQYDNNADGTDIVVEIPRKQQTTTLTFSADGTFTAVYAERYLPAWDARYFASGTRFYTLVDPPVDLSVQTNHESSANAAFVGYEGNYGNGDTRVEYTGTWRRFQRESIMDNEDDYTWDFSVKITRRIIYTYTITETATNYTVSNTVFRDFTWIAEDADWNSYTIALNDLSAGGATEGTELAFTLAGFTSVGSGIYTQL